MRPRLALVLVAALGLSCASEDDLQGAVVVVIDTLRADRVGAYGHEPDTSPVLDALAARGVLFEQAVSSSSWTLPSFIGLLSGRWATERVFARGLQVSLVSQLRDAGFATGAFTEGAYVSATFGLDRGFDTFVETDVGLEGAGHDVGPGVGVEQTFDTAIEWLREHADQRFFLLVHTYEVHTPYRRAALSGAPDRGALGETFEIADVLRVRDGALAVGPTESAYLAQIYDGGVREADRQLGRLLAALADADLAARTLVVVTSDHGEDFGERYAERAGDHGHSLYDELLRVPLVLFDPRPGDAGAGGVHAGRRIEAQVRGIDVLPTVLDLLGVPVPRDTDGSSLAPLVRGEERGDRPALSRLFPRGGNGIGPMRTGLRVDGRKVLINLPFVDPPAPASVEVYDLATDPGERVNLADSDPTARAALLERLRAESVPVAAEGFPDLRPRGALSDEARARLEALGYVE